MKILGIDPGLQFSGFGVLKREKQRVFLIDYGLLKLSTKENLSKRIELFHNFFHEKIEEFNITDIALETPFLGKNAQNFLKLGYLRGILHLLASKKTLNIHEFSPREVKLSVTGYGGASKEQLAKVIFRLFPNIIQPKKNDVTDALAVTLCGLWKNRKLWATDN